jgi:hypothetical protein
MVKEHSLDLMEQSISGNTRMGFKMVKEYLLLIWGLNLKLNGTTINLGPEFCMIKMEKLSQSI